jgi:hypothetical protein
MLPETLETGRCWNILAKSLRSCPGAGDRFSGRLIWTFLYAKKVPFLGGLAGLAGYGPGAARGYGIASVDGGAGPRQWVSAFDEEVADVGQQQDDGGQDEQGCHGRAPVACGGPECQPDRGGHGSHSDQTGEEPR